MIEISARNPFGFQMEQSERIPNASRAGALYSTPRYSTPRHDPLLTSANADTRGRAVDGPHASVSLLSLDPLWAAGKQDPTRWLR